MSEHPKAIHRGALAAIFVLGLLLGLFTALQATRLLLLGPVHISVGGLAALVLNGAVGVAAAWGLQSREVALLPGVGWFVATLALFFLPHPGGDVMLPQSGGAVIAFLILGVLGAFAAAAIATRVTSPSPRTRR